ncbi:MAG: type IX secretion system outer membrane channel protein PorV [Flavobacterium sp.]|nr:type IX secretion system outer membrane channel protein PorV [Flavobacterium sp.]
MNRIAILLFCFAANSNIKAQERVITTGVPFLLIAADARAAGLGDQGVATSADAFSQQWNPAKYAFSNEKQGFTTSYTPYLTALVNDISLGQVNYFNRYNERSAFAVSIRYFSLGEIELRDNAFDPANVVKPNEFSLDGSYALKLSDKFSMSVAGRFISSSLKIDSNNDRTAATTFAFDVAGFFQSEQTAFNDFDGRYRIGFNFQNLGPKINYDANVSDINANFLPAQMKLGGSFDFIFDDYNKITTSLEFSKLLVPTPQVDSSNLYDYNQDGATNTQDIRDANADYKKIGWVSGIFNSFNDAPGGFGEEIKEITYSAAAEYLYQDSFAMRLGYFHESPLKGARQYFTFGAGFKYNVVKIDVSYLMSTSKVQNPLENTLRFSLTFNFGDKYDDY